MHSWLVFLSLACTQIWAAPKQLDQVHQNFPQKPIHCRKYLNENSSTYWKEKAQRAVSELLSKQPNTNVAKNVILFIGDGMSIPTIAAARAYQGGEESQLSFEKFPYTALSKTYAVDKQVSDSANTATAYLGGVKANHGTIGVGPEVAFNDCLGMMDPSTHIHSIAHYSQLKNKRTGLVTTTRVTHASPAGVYAHTANRGWEADADMNFCGGVDIPGCWDIARQLVDGATGKNLNVILGGGRNKFSPANRIDHVNLIRKWQEQTSNSRYVWNREQLLSLGDGVDNILGLFSEDHMDYNVDRDPVLDPSLAEMTRVAIETLSKGGNGYFLFVEGAHIDMAHHETKARIALNETVEFSRAVQTAVEFTDESDTLIVVTADHSHTMSYSGYADRHSDILGLAGHDTDHVPYATLSYANGPGYKEKGSDVSTDNMSNNPHYEYPALVNLKEETHGGDDVAVFARGPWAHLFSGVLEQNILPHLMSYASCVGDGLTACDLDTSNINEA